MTLRAWYGLSCGLVLVVACSSSDEGGGSAGSGGSKAGASSTAGGGGKAGSPSTGGSNAGTAGKGGAGSSGSAGSPGEGGSGVAGEGGGGSAGQPEGGAAGSGGEGGEPAPVPAVAYISTVLGDLLVASLDPASGKPALLPSSPIDVEGFLHGVAVHPNGKVLFVPADPARIDSYPIAEDGSLPAEPSSSAEVDDDNPLLGMALDPLGRFAYGVSPFSQTIYVFKVNQQTGALTASGEPLLVGPEGDRRSPAFVALDPSGKFAYVTQMASGSPTGNGIRAYAVDQESGELTELSTSPFAAGGVIAGALAFRPDGRFLFSTGAGVNAFAVAEDGTLELVDGSPFSLDVSTDAWAPNIAMHPQGKLLYVSDFLRTRHVTGFLIDPETGALDEVAGTPPTTTAPYSIALGPGGRFLYVNDDNGETSVFAVTSATGALTKLDDSPFPFGGLEADFAFAVLP